MFATESFLTVISLRKARIHCKWFPLEHKNKNPGFFPIPICLICFTRCVLGFGCSSMSLRGGGAIQINTA